MDNLEEMNEFLERYNLPGLNQEEIENMNRPITSTESETVIKKRPANKTYCHLLGWKQAKFWVLLPMAESCRSLRKSMSALRHIDINT